MKPCSLFAFTALILTAFADTCTADSMLRITCAGDDVGAEVYIDGKFKGECPVDVKVPEGVVKLRVQKAVDAEHEPRLFEQEIRMGDGVVKKLDVKLGEAKLNAEGRKREEERTAQMQAELKKQGVDLGSAVVTGKNTFRDCPDCPEMVVIPAGSFEMGSPGSEAGRFDDEGPVHRVRVSAFALAKTEITRGQFAAFVNETGYRADGGCLIFEGGKWENRSGRNWRDPGYRQGDNHPAACLNWNDAKAFADWISRKTGRTYRLPSEAEWEYAYRAGTTTARYWGEGPDQACDYANVADLTAKSQVTGASDWSVYNCTDGHAYTSPVASFRPNAFGLYDMSGNVWEWMEDSYHDNYNPFYLFSAPADGSAWQGDGAKRVLRGGSWDSNPRGARAAIRDWFVSADRRNFNGFRLARTLP